MREQDKMKEDLSVGRWVRHREKLKPFQLTDSHFKGVSARNKEWFSKLKLWRPQEGEVVLEVYEDFVLIQKYSHTKGLPNLIPYVGQSFKDMV